MKESVEGNVMRIFVGETDTRHGRPLYELIVEKAKALDLAGATVFRGIMGYGAHRRLHTAKLLRLSEDLPVVVEIVDRPENLEKLIPFLDDIVKEGIVTMEPVKIIKYRDG